MKKTSLRTFLIAGTALTTSLALPSIAAACPADPGRITHGGGNGGNVGAPAVGAFGGCGGIGGGGGGGASGFTPGGSASNTLDQGDGGTGAGDGSGVGGAGGGAMGGGSNRNGDNGANGSGGGGGGVGIETIQQNAPLFINGLTISGGDGGTGSQTQDQIPHGGGGGGGGVGIVLGNGGQITVSSGSTITGGNGGLTLEPYAQGGNGGAGIFLYAGGELLNGGTVQGGFGGVNGNHPDFSGSSGAGVLSNGGAITNTNMIAGGTDTGAGDGGVGIEMYGGTLNNEAGATIRGGNGGDNQVGGAGSGAIGVIVDRGAQATITNLGTIKGGDVGLNAVNTTATGGVGVQINADNSTLINGGSISRGVSVSGRAIANAVELSGRNDRLELWSGYSFTGNVVATQGNGAVLALGGSDNTSFDVSKIGSQYQGFDSYEKTGTSTWTLIGTTNQQTDWMLKSGTLSIAAVGALGSSASTLTFNGGTLQTTFADGLVLQQKLVWGDKGGTFDISNASAILNVFQGISGKGQLTKTGSGRLALGGTNDYSGATTIESGVLQIDTESASSEKSAYTVQKDAALELALGGVHHHNRIGSLSGEGTVTLGSNTLTTGVDNTSTQFSGVIVDGTSLGGGSLIKEGTGTFILSGDSTYTGTTTVNAGTLDIEGSIVSATTVAAGATLTGTGTVGDVTIANGGQFAPGSGIPKSSMTITGNLALLSGAQYLAQLNPTDASFVDVKGTATLGNATVNLTYGSGTYVEKRYTLITADGGVKETFGNVINTGMPDNFHATLNYDQTHVFLDLALNYAAPNGPLNGNQQQVADTLTNFYNSNGKIPMAFGALNAQGLTQASGELGTSSQQTAFQATTMFMNLLSDPFSAGRGVDVNRATGFAEESASENQSMAYAGRAKSNNPRDAFAAFTKAPPLFAQRWSVWASGFGGSQTTDGNAATGSNTTNSAVYGAAAGADYWFSPDTVAGFALAGGGSNFSVAGGGTGRSDLFQAGAFVRQNFGATYLTASAAYGWQDVTTDRTITVAGADHLRAEFNTNSYSGRLELGHRFLTPWVGGLGVSPYAAAQVTAFELPSYAERAISGASTFALNYGADTSTATRSELGLRTDKSYALDGAVLTLRGRAAWAHDFNPNTSVTATFQTLPGASFVVNGAALASDTALTTASAEVRWLNGWSVAGTFEGEFSNVTRSYAGKGVVRYAW
jgi:autotransporter-associated beta strand protein